MSDDPRRQPMDDDLEARRERVVNAVMLRIADAPPRALERHAWVEIAPWRRPALAAAVLIIVAAAASLLTSGSLAGGPTTVAESLGLAPPLARYVETGQLDAWEWLATFEGRR